MRQMRGEVSKKFSFLLYMDRVHEKGNLTFLLDFFRIPAPTPLNYVHSMGAGLQKIR